MLIYWFIVFDLCGVVLRKRDRTLGSVEKQGLQGSAGRAVAAKRLGAGSGIVSVGTIGENE